MISSDIIGLSGFIWEGVFLYIIHTDNVYKRNMIEPEKGKRRHADPALCHQHLEQMQSQHTCKCVRDCENPELAARHSKCPKTKIHFKMFLFRIFIHRSGLIFHFINAFISYLFSLPQGILHTQMNKYRFTLCFPAVLERWAPDTLQS